MDDIKFVSWRPVIGHNFLGIATVEVNGIVLRYKVMQGKENKGIFITCCAYPVKREDGTVEYVNSFAASTIELRKKIESEVRDNI